MTTRFCNDCKKEFDIFALHTLQVSPFTTVEVCSECEEKYVRKTIVYPQEVKVWVRDGSVYDAIYRAGDTVSGWYKKEVTRTFEPPTGLSRKMEED